MSRRWKNRPFKWCRSPRWGIWAFILLLLIGLFALDRHVMPLILQYSKAQAQFHVTRELNEAVTAVLAELQPEYDELVTVSRDAEGNITSVEADMRKLNQVKAAVSTAVTERIGNKRKITVSMPLGTLLGSHLFTGRGPMIHIPVSVSGSVLTDIVSHFEAAGVNQTSHRVEMQMNASVIIAAPTAPTSVGVDTTFIIAESILLGKVPDAYMHVNGDERSAEEQIFDFQSQLQK